MTWLTPERSGRHSIRLKGYDYSQAGGYFVTIVTRQRECLFGEISNGEMIFNDAGQMVGIEWRALQERFPNIGMDVYQVMPNHFHGIMLIHPPDHVGAGLVPAHAIRATTPFVPRTPAVRRCETARVAPTIGEIVGAFKSITTHGYIRGVDEFGWSMFTKKIWQRNFYEHIIRNQEDYERIAGYILDNPAKWADDEENPLVSA